MSAQSGAVQVFRGFSFCPVLAQPDPTKSFLPGTTPLKIILWDNFGDNRGDNLKKVFRSHIATITPVLGEKAAHNGNVVYSLDFQVTPHQLRHTYITNLIYAGVDPETVQYLAGHENSKITMDIYAKVKYNSPDALSSIVNNAFNNIYSPEE